MILSYKQIYMTCSDAFSIINLENRTKHFRRFVSTFATTAFFFKRSWKEQASAQYIHHCVALLLQTKTKSLANRNRTSDRWISVLRYSPPLYQLSYRELGYVTSTQINFWTLIHATKILPTIQPKDIWCHARWHHRHVNVSVHNVIQHKQYESKIIFSFLTTISHSRISNTYSNETSRVFSNQLHFILHSHKCFSSSFTFLHKVHSHQQCKKYLFFFLSRKCQCQYQDQQTHDTP